MTLCRKIAGNKFLVSPLKMRTFIDAFRHLPGTLGPNTNQARDAVFAFAA